MLRQRLLLGALLLLCGCANVNPVPPPEGGAPDVTLTATPRRGPAPLVVQFSAQATDPDGGELTYLWSFPDEEFEAGARVSYTFQTPGTYQVGVEVDDGTSTASASVRVEVTGRGGGEAASVTVTPGEPGPAPWTVAYEVETTGFEGAVTLEASCDGLTFRQGRTVYCHHLSAGAQGVAVVAEDPTGERAEGRASVTLPEPTEGVAYYGTWEVVQGGQRSTVRLRETPELGYVAAGTDPEISATLFVREEGGTLSVGFERGTFLETGLRATLDAQGRQRFVGEDGFSLTKLSRAVQPAGPAGRR